MNGPNSQKAKVAQRALRGFLAPPVDRVIDDLDRRQANPGHLPGLPTGLPDLDELLSLEPGMLCVLAARTSVGKTTLALNIAAHVAIRLERLVAFASLEMAKEDITRRIIASEAQVPLKAIRRGRCTADQLGAVNGAANSVHASQLRIDDTSRSLADIRKELLGLGESQGQPALVVVDYLQFLRAPERGMSREQEVAANSRGLKDLAMELELPVLALAQLSRRADDDNDRPRLSHLRESGAIEQDADAVVLIHRDATEQEGAHPGEEFLELVVAKQRNGELGSVPVLARRPILRIEPRDAAAPAVRMPARGEAAGLLDE